MFINNEDIIFDQDDILDEITLQDYTPESFRDIDLYKGGSDVYQYILKQQIKPLGIYQDIPVEITSLIQDYIDPIPSITISNVSVFEDKGEALFIVRLNKSSENIVSATYKTIAGTALAGQDFVHTEGQIVFNPGKVDTFIKIPIIVDDIAEASESFTVEVFDPVNGKMGNNVATCVINENVGDYPIISVLDSVATYEGQESEFEIRLDKPWDEQIDIELYSLNGTATKHFDYDARFSVSYNNGETYVPLDDNITRMVPGITTLMVRILTYTDAIAEIDENYYLSVVVTSGNTQNGEASAQALILNNDIESLLVYYNIFINKKKGTTNIVNFILAFLGVDGRVEEWWERGLKPYEYNITFTNGKTFLRMDVDEVRDIIKIINLFKNERSRLASLSSPLCFNLLVLSQMCKLDWTMLSDTPGTPIGLDNITICSIQNYTVTNEYDIAVGGKYKLRTSEDFNHTYAYPYGMMLDEYELNDVFESFVKWCLTRHRPTVHIRPYKKQMVWEKISDTLHLSEFGDAYYQEQLTEEEIEKLETFTHDCMEGSTLQMVLGLGLLDNSSLDSGCSEIVPTPPSQIFERIKLRDVLFEDRLEYKPEHVSNKDRNIVEDSIPQSFKIKSVYGFSGEEQNVDRFDHRQNEKEVILGPKVMNPSFELGVDFLDSDLGSYDYEYLLEFVYIPERGRIDLDIAKESIELNYLPAYILESNKEREIVYSNFDEGFNSNIRTRYGWSNSFERSNTEWGDYLWWSRHLKWEEYFDFDRVRFQTIRKYEYNREVFSETNIEFVHNIIDVNGEFVVSDVVAIDDKLIIQ